MTQVAIIGAALLGCLILFALPACQAHARSMSATLLNSSEILPFDLPAQPLSDALADYSRLTNLSVLLDSDDVRHMAPAVKGDLTRKQALAGLLADSGLAAFFVDGRFIVVRSPASHELHGIPTQKPLSLEKITGVRMGAQDHGFYVVRAQQAVWNALCASPLTRPGTYRLTMQMWVSARGQVRRLNLLSTTGNAARDTAIGRALGDLSVGVAPSPGMPQPIVLLLVPVSKQAMPECATGAPK